MKTVYILLSIVIVIAIIVVLVIVLKPKQKQKQALIMGEYSEWTPKCIHCGDTVTQTRVCSNDNCEGPSTQTKECTGCNRYIQKYGLRCNIHDPKTQTVWGMPCKYSNGSFTSDPNPSHVYVYNPENKLYYQEQTKKCINKKNELDDCKLNKPDLQWEVNGLDISPIDSDISSRITELP
jgi:hypothetical protein